MKPSLATLGEILARSGCALDDGPLALLWEYHQMLRAANVALNLTRIHNFENMVIKHYVDSLIILNFTDLPSPLVDLGSGPGLPGIPLKIARPETEIILAEQRGARAEFLRGVIERLELKGITVFDGKVGPRFTASVQGVVTRAFAAIPETLDLVARCVAPGGRVLFMKGPACDDEIAAARKDARATFRLRDDHAYQLPGTTHDRRLVVFERLSDSRADEARASDRPIVESRDVTSTSNATYRHLLELLHGQGIRKHGEALIAGSKVIPEVLARHGERVLAWVAPPDIPPPDALGRSITWIKVSRGLLRELDISGTHQPLLHVRAPEILEWTDAPESPAGCTLFVPFQDPENVGAVIRSADAFGVSRVVLLREAAHPFHPKASRAAGTSLFQVPILRGPALSELKVETMPLFALAKSGTPLDGVAFPERFGIVVGLEGQGLASVPAGALAVRIPISDRVDSLNAPTAAAIALFEWRREQHARAPDV